MRTRIGLIGLAAATLVACNKPSDYDGDGYTADIDCNDNDAAIHPDATEVCDGVDNNCDSSIDGADADGAIAYFADADADGYGGTALSITQCDAPSGFAGNSDDCDDTDASINPDAAEICDLVDNDCDALIDDEDDSVDTAGFSTYYGDADSDGYGQPDVTVESCNAPTGYADNADDCDDTNADLNPETVWYSDVDGDSFGAANYSMMSCEQPDGYVGNADDCDDLVFAVNPDALEICDGGIDNDCDGLSDDDDDSVETSTYSTYYSDGDADGYGDDGMSITQCALPSGYSALGGDCDDAEPLANPGGTEICADGIDNDCSGDAPECTLPTVGTSADAGMSFVASSGSYFGYEEMEIGDFNGDGVNDLAVGDYYDSVTGDYGQGSVSFFYGPFSADSENSPDGMVYGENSYDYFGEHMANMGDINGDGADDLAVGADGYDVGSYSSVGALYLVSGTTSTESAVANQSTNFGFSGANVLFEDESYIYAGVVANLGDVFGTGGTTLGYGGYGYDTPSTSSGFIYYGDLSSGSTGIVSGDYYDQAGYKDRVEGMSDLDGDGFDDWAASGAMSYSSGNSYAGEVWVFYGATSASWSYTSDADAILEGNASDYLGSKLAGGADIDGDGYDDLFASTNGSVEVYFGSAGRLYFGQASDISIEDTTSSYSSINGSALSVGDLTGDGTGDLVMADYFGANNLGVVWTFYGPLSSGTYDVTSADSTLTGGATYDYFGRDNKVGDMDGDGIDDLLVGEDGQQTVWMFNGGSM
ncbi:MAG: MopE-related protein [Myxococcota bacterium]|nr:MopE-related protein [Myxococcota bacterium]